MESSNGNQFISIITPTYKEAGNLRHLIPMISKVMEEESLSYEIIIVDDNSADGTEEIISGLSGEVLPLRVIVRRNERDLSSAVVEGFRQAKGDILVCMDADWSHPPHCIPALISELNKPDVDFVIGSRFVPGAVIDEKWGIMRRLASKIAMVTAMPLTRAKDPLSGFFALDKKTFQESEELVPIGFKIGLELIVKCNCTHISEVPIHFANRKFETSKFSFREQIKYMRHITRLYYYKSRRFFGLAGARTQ